MDDLKIPPIVLVPFEAAMAFLFLLSGILAFFGSIELDAFDLLLPKWLFYTFLVCYIIMGFAIILGLTYQRTDVEAGGLILFISVLLSRALMYGYLLGWGQNFITTMLFSLVFVAACLARLYVIVRVTNE